MFTEARIFAKRIAPGGLVLAYRAFRQKVRDTRNAGRPARDVFAEIYSKNLWGGAPGEFSSGTGSSTQRIVDPYVDVVSRLLAELPTGQRHVVDLGCGDFQIGRRLIAHCDSYIGVDIVPSLIDHLTTEHADAKTSFRCLDIAEDDLPAGDVCLVRQVLQHLSNAQISKVLDKLSRYKIILVTEHIPEDREASVFNRDKVHGGSIRLSHASGVYVDQAPFNFRPGKMEVALELPGHGVGAKEAGLIRTQKFDLRTSA